MASHPGSLQSCGRPPLGQRASEEKSTPDHNTAAYSSTPNSKPAEAYEQPQSKQLDALFSGPPSYTFELRLNQTCEHESAQPEP